MHRLVHGIIGLFLTFHPRNTSKKIYVQKIFPHVTALIAGANLPMVVRAHHQVHIDMYLRYMRLTQNFH